MFIEKEECRERGLDQVDTNLLVADEWRTEKTICLAVSSSLKSYGIPGRPRLFEVVQQVREPTESVYAEYQGNAWRESPVFLPSLKRFPNWPSTLSLRRREWRSICSTVRESIIFTASILRQRILLCILSTKCLWM